jgi:hypothetical protein
MFDKLSVEEPNPKAGSANTAVPADTALIGQITQMIKFPDNEQIRAPTLHQRKFINKLPQRLFQLLSKYDDQQILAIGESPAAPAMRVDESRADHMNAVELERLGIVGAPGEQLLRFKKDYYQFQSEVKQTEDEVLLRIGQLVSYKWTAREQWEVFLNIAAARFDGKSQAELISYNGSAQLDYGITWDDAEKVFAELAREPQISNKMYKIPRLQLKMIDEASKAAWRVERSAKRDRQSLP